MENLTYKVGRGGGWLYDNHRLSLHQLDAFLLYRLAKITPKSKIKKQDNLKT